MRDSGGRRRDPSGSEGGFEKSRRTVSGVAGVRVHRRGLFGIVDGDDGVDGPDEEVAALGLVELEAVDASAHLCAKVLSPLSVAASTRRRATRDANAAGRARPTSRPRSSSRDGYQPPVGAMPCAGARASALPPRSRRSSDEAERRENLFGPTWQR